MGLLDTINTSSGKGNSKAYVPAGKHRLLIKESLIKIGTSKNVGKEYFIVSGEFINSSRTDLPACNKGMPFSVFVETKQYPEMAGDKIKNILMSLATEDELANLPRNQMPQNCLQGPAEGVGITWAEFFSAVINAGAAVGSEVDVIATDVDRSAKGKPPVTNYDFQKKGLPPMEIVPAPIAATPVQPAQPNPATPGVTSAVPPTQAPQQATAPLGGSLFGPKA